MQIKIKLRQPYPVSQWVGNMMRFDRFTESAQQAAQLSAEIIQRYSHNQIDVEHLLLALLEQPRGEVVYYVKGNGTKFLERYRARTPTFANIPAMVHLLKQSDLADVPVIILTIDPCISCTER